MESITNLLVAFVAGLHIYFLYLEMFAWTSPKGLKIFRNDAEFAKRSAVLAANQGLYNGFLAAGLIWSAIASIQGNSTEAFHLKIFFLGCVFIAGLYGGYSANKKIFFIQALPALVSLVFVYLAY